ncbi:MAG TPA: 4-hydroxythreonine-4-phosphate dehydrogenase PdxA [Myxococcales bacterium]|nr:4-hydroxythreonine-4-phosphate dehydrogenase PdxA [Myxococcales bacterium]
MIRVAVSMGDPLGIGPEVVTLALASPAVRAALRPVVFGDRVTLGRAAALRAVKLDAEIVQVGSLAATPTHEAAGASALAAVDAAANACLAGTAQALCTAPLSKERAALSSPGFVGHTERLALSTGTRVAMMMAGPRLRVVLATNHLALADVPRKLSTAQIAFVTRLAATELRSRWNIPSPRLAVCGLNPHAGDGGLFGDEDARIVAPAILEARASGVDATGPWPADGLFPRAAKGEFDAVVALYHDQGLIPAKLLDFADTVNVTLGLPFPRTSPDHGTADDIAWRSKADPAPMISALLLAARLARSQTEKGRT